MIRSFLFFIASMAFMLCVSLVQSTLPEGHSLSNAVLAEAAKSPYKKSFARSKRLVSKSRRRSSSGSCILWNANKINEKAKPYKAFIDQAARKHRIDRNLIKAVITAESCFRVTAKSPKGAQGLMQLIPATAKRFGVSDSYVPKQNISGGTKYLRFLMTRFKGNLTKVIASYNAGEGAVDKYNGIPPYKETKQYVKNVMQVYKTLNPKPMVAKVPAQAQKLVYKPPVLGHKAGRQGWQYNRSLAPHLYKQ